MHMDQWFLRTMAAIEKIAQSQEVCRLGYCLTKSEWASWVQAVGSILAILVAIGVALYQIKKQHRMTQQLSVDRVRTFVANISGTAEQILNDDNVTEFDLRCIAGSLQEAISVASNITGDYLNIEWIAAMEITRMSAVKLRIIIEDASHDIHRLPSARKEIEKLSKSLKRADCVVMQGHPGVPFSEEKFRPKGDNFFS